MLLVLAGGCSEGENALLNPGSGRTGLFVAPDTAFVDAPEADRVYSPVLSTGATPVLYLARTDSVETTVYMRFADLPDSDLVGRVRLGVRLAGGGGGGLRVATYEVEEDWTEVDLRVDRQPEISDDPIYVRPNAVEPNDDSTLVEAFSQIPLELFRRWKRDPDTNHGIALRLTPDSPPGWLEILSSEANLDSVDIANPEVVFLATGSDSVIATESPTADAFAYEVLPAWTPPDGESPTLVVAEWVPARSLIRFAVPEGIPRGSAVNRAILRLHLASALPAEDRYLAVYRVETEWTESAAPDSVVIDGLYDRILVPADVDSAATVLEFDVGRLVQRWVDGEANQGLVVVSSAEATGGERVVFHSAEAELARTPTLTVIYTAPPGSRWGGNPPSGEEP